jgi:hypothetical protein
MGMAQQIRILMVKQGNIPEAELARRLGQSPANFNGKMKRDKFSVGELREIAEALGYELEVHFIDKATGEKT